MTTQTNPFDDESLQFRVLVNNQEQHSLWPDFIAIPSGWQSIYGPGKRTDCLAFIEQNWPDIRPLSLRTQLS